MRKNNYKITYFNLQAGTVIHYNCFNQKGNIGASFTFSDLKSSYLSTIFYLLH